MPVVIDWVSKHPNRNLAATFGGVTGSGGLSCTPFCPPVASWFITPPEEREREGERERDIIYIFR